MANKIFDKNYSNQSLTIPTSIWNDTKIHGIAKIILTLIKAFTNQGSKTCYALTLQTARMCNTHEKDIKYNMQKLHEAGHIKLFKDPDSPTGWSIEYTYKDIKPSAPDSSGTSGLF